MASQPNPIRDPVEAFFRALPYMLSSWLPVRRKRSRPISVADFVSSGSKYHPPGEIPPRLRDFVPRKDREGRDLVKRVVKLLDSHGKVVLWGDGGVGKSTLAYQAAAVYAAKRPFGLAWISADGVEGFSIGHFTSELATFLGCEPGFVAACEALRARPHIVVLDNADTIEDLALFLSLAQSFPARSRLLITSRLVDQRFRGLGEAVEMDVMREEEALAYARLRARAMDPAPSLTENQLKDMVRLAGNNPEAIWWLLGYAQRGRLDEALRDMPTGTGLAAEEKQGPGRIFGRTWGFLTLRERFALCVLSLVPQASRELLQDATGDPSIADTLDVLWRWHLARQDGTGRTWAVTGLTRGMARARLYTVLDDLHARMGQEGPQGREAATALARFAASGTFIEVLDRMGHWHQRVTYGERGLAAARLLRDKGVVAAAAHHLAMAYHHQGRLKEAEDLCRESLALKRELGHKQGIAITLHQLGNVAYLKGDLKEAEGLYRESLALERELGHKQGIAQTLAQMGLLREQQGNHREAESLLKEALGLFRELGSPTLQQAERDLARVRQALGRAGGPGATT